MKWYKNLRISIKLQLAFALVVLIVVGMGITIRMNVQEVHYLGKRVLEDNVPSAYYATEAIMSLNAAETHVRQFALSRSKEHVDAGIKDLNNALESLQKCYNASSMQENRQAAEHVKGKIEEYKSVFLKLAASKAGDASYAIQEKEYWKKVDECQEFSETELGNISERSRNAMDKGKAEMMGTMEATESSVLYIVAVVVGLCLVLSWVVSSIISRPIISLKNVAEQVAQRNFSVRSENTSKDEIGKLSQSFNAMMDNLEDSIEESTSAQKSAEELAQGAEIARLKTEEQERYLSNSVNVIIGSMQQFAKGDLTVQLPVQGEDAIAQLYHGFNQSVDNIRLIVGNVKHAIEAAANSGAQISAGTEQMSVGAREQSNQVSEVAAAMEEMSRTIDDNAQLAGKTSEIAQASRHTALEGGKVIEESIAKVKDIASSVETVGATVQHLGERGKEIGQIVSTIKEIADQTNLLALNAAIEAARAGEQGRGFAVVADEVRKLAERTQSSTKEIEAKIGAIQSETMHAVEMMGKSMTLVQEGISLSDGAGRSLQTIVSSVEQVVETVDMIAKANTEQAVVGATVARNIENISNVSQETAKGLSDVANATTSLSQMTQNLQALATQFRLDNSMHDTSNGMSNGGHLIHNAQYRNTASVHSQSLN